MATKKRKYCIVPCCSNSTVSTDKVFIQVPCNEKMRKLWIQAVRRRETDFSPKSNVLFVCEDHFNLEEDMENYVKWKLVGGNKKMKDGVVPHIFKCLVDRKETERGKLRVHSRKRSCKHLLHAVIVKGEPLVNDTSSSPNNIDAVNMRLQAEKETYGASFPNNNLRTIRLVRCIRKDDEEILENSNFQVMGGPIQLKEELGIYSLKNQETVDDVLSKEDLIEESWPFCDEEDDEESPQDIEENFQVFAEPIVASSNMEEIADEGTKESDTDCYDKERDFPASNSSNAESSVSHESIVGNEIFIKEEEISIDGMSEDEMHSREDLDDVTHSQVYIKNENYDGNCPVVPVVQSENIIEPPVKMEL